MIGVVAFIGTPFWPWHALQTCTLASTSSAALAGTATTANIAAAPQAAETRFLNILYPPLVCPRCRMDGRNATKRARPVRDCSKTGARHAANAHGAQAPADRFLRAGSG